MELSDLKRRKNNLKLTVGQLSMLADLPVGTVSKIMTGETQNPSYLTVDILDKTLAREESRARVEAFRNAMMKYIKEHPDEEFIYEDFEKKYREEHRLNRKAIPFATPDNDPYWISGSLALEAPQKKPKEDHHISYEEYCSLPESSLTELIDGHMIVNQPPSYAHQNVVMNLGDEIKSYIRKNSGDCRMFNVGFGARFYDTPDTCLIPDIMVVCEPDRITDYYVWDPDWIIEVTSPSTRRRDYGEKRSLYIQAGVREYWIVDLEKSKVITWTRDDDINLYGFGDDIPVHIYDGKLKIKIEDCL